MHICIYVGVGVYVCMYIYLLCYMHFHIHTLIYTLSFEFSPHSFYVFLLIFLYISLYSLLSVCLPAYQNHTDCTSKYACTRTHTHTHRNWSGACLYTSLNSSESYGLHGQICTHMYLYPWTSPPCYTICIHISCHARTYVKPLYICGAKWGTYAYLKGPFSVHVDQYIYRCIYISVYIDVMSHAHHCTTYQPKP